ncbi:hypothetical protein BJ508DRAFT_329485 [Ascobolus immersus RN42]|uniref:Uncharacterized protein n=1 Tax=Ascobolus immersus RN42 TaxID=1160509 RepID=A0A3N4HYN9_ASCIM|nr:hypothetical protein BJ508DRAFT_329485 [Ascobolus immersus RN42]
MIPDTPSSTPVIRTLTLDDPNASPADPTITQYVNVITGTSKPRFLRSTVIPNPNYDGPNLPGQGLKTGAIIAIVIAVLVGLAIQTLLILWLVKIRRAETRRRDEMKALGNNRVKLSMDVESMGKGEDVSVLGGGLDAPPPYASLNVRERP